MERKDIRIVQCVMMIYVMVRVEMWGKIFFFFKQKTAYEI